MDRLAQSERWWAKLLAVELNDRFASLRQPEALKALANDENALIRTRARKVLERHQSSATNPARN
jgi:hypothetical protein